MTKRFRSAVIFGATLAFVGCQSSSSPSSAPPPSTPSSGQQALSPQSTLSTVSQILNLPPGTAVDMSGLYFGWKGPCKGQPPTRSAWQLVESNEPFAPCIYVDGPAVAGVSPNAPPTNLLLVVHGTLRTEGPQRYVEASRVEKK